MRGGNGAYIVPWGRFYNGLRKELVLAMTAEEDGGTGIAKRFWEWSEEQVKAFVLTWKQLVCHDLWICVSA